MDIGIKTFRNVNAKYLILSGGITNSEMEISEADVMAFYAKINGIKEETIITEKNSIDTIGNAYNTRKIFDSLEKIYSIYLVSSCYHIPRVSFIFSYFFKGFRINLDNCYRIERGNAEKTLYLKAVEFFNGIEPGDFSSLEKMFMKWYR